MLYFCPNIPFYPTPHRHLQRGTDVSGDPWEVLSVPRREREAAMLSVPRREREAAMLSVPRREREAAMLSVPPLPAMPVGCWERKFGHFERVFLWELRERR
ncbi:hypothetical protein chiPu_0029917 [Chiloscyllium punctatum]|uniref:Uncharacterized protein n=1 Tax=Chiloscyllium punctatum TaxID=137246 RepID=A0A401TSU2_CHIPU|nr:hypothetical protein [Chiloscyllium punctatum]